MPKCVQCGKNDAQEMIKYKRCARCNHPAYCNQNCQSVHWHLHKTVCKTLKEIPHQLLLLAAKPDTHELQHYIKAGASVHVTDQDGVTALWSAATNGNVTAAEILIESDANVNQARHDNGSFPLLVATHRGHIHMVNLLLRHQASPHLKAWREYRGATALYTAASEGHLPIVQALCDAGALIDETNDEGATPFFVAIFKNHDAVALYFIQQGASPYITTQNGDSLLVVMASQEKLSLFEALVSKHGHLNLEMPNLYGVTPLYAALYIAAKNNRPDVVRHLRNLCPPDVVTLKTPQNSRTPLFIASASGHIEVVRILVEAGDPIEETTENGLSSFFIAVYQNHLHIVKYFIYHLKAQNKLGLIDQPEPLGDMTPLYFAAQFGYHPIAHCLIKAGADFRKPSAAGLSPLFKATAHNHPPLILELLNAYAWAPKDTDPTEFEKALEICARMGTQYVYTLLNQALDNIDSFRTGLVPPWESASLPSIAPPPFSGLETASASPRPGGAAAHLPVASNQSVPEVPQRSSRERTPSPSKQSTASAASVAGAQAPPTQSSRESRRRAPRVAPPLAIYHAPFTVWDHARNQIVNIEYVIDVHAEQRAPVSANVAYLLIHQNHVQAFYAFSSAIVNEFTQADLSRMRDLDTVPALPLGLQGKKKLSGEEAKIAPKIMADAKGLGIAPCKIKSFTNGLIDKEVYGLCYPPQAQQNNPAGRQYALYYFCFVFDHKFNRLL
jgi:ankyrin repeat protein